MTGARRTRLKRLDAMLPPPSPPRALDSLTEAELRAMPPEELLARFEARLRTPEALARQAALERLSDAELLELWLRRR